MSLKCIARRVVRSHSSLGGNVNVGIMGIVPGLWVARECVWERVEAVIGVV